jgi:sRNA-binding carbon storage regulator CsrA
VMAVHGHQVRIGIKAPRDVIVDRQEVAERKQKVACLRNFCCRSRQRQINAQEAPA